MSLEKMLERVLIGLEVALQKQAEAQFQSLMGVERQSEATPESAKVIAIASVQAEAAWESRGIGERKPVSLGQTGTRVLMG